MVIRMIIAVWVLGLVGAFVYTSIDKFTYPLELYWDSEENNSRGGFFYIPEAGRLKKDVYDLQLPWRSITLWTTYYDNKDPKVARLERQALKAAEDARHTITLRTSNGWYFQYDDRKGIDVEELKLLASLKPRKGDISNEKSADSTYRHSMDVDVQCESIAERIKSGNRLD